VIATHRVPTTRMLLAGLAVVLASCGGVAPASPAAPGPSGAVAQTTTPTAPTASGPTPSAAALPDDVPRAKLDVAVADVVATGTITPEHGGIVTGSTADGATWTLAVEPWAVRTPTTVELRPLSGTSALGRVVAGVDLGPAGLRLAIPATLTVTGLAVPSTVVALEYRGEAAGADARLVIGPGTADGSPTFSVAHFSGNVAVDVGADANALFDKWSAARGGDTPDGRQAAAETRYAAADLARRNGRISAETADGIQSRAKVEWMEAEADRLATDPALSKLAESGDPRDLDVIGTELGRILQIEHELAIQGDTSRTEAFAKVVDTLAAYEAAIVTKVVDSQGIQDASRSGLVSDMGEILDLATVVLTLEHSLQVLGAEDSGAGAKILKLLESMASGFLASCKEAPLDPAIVLGLDRLVQLLGGTASSTITQVLECTAPQGWLVEAEDNFIAGSARLCADDVVITNPGSEDAGIFVESGGGMPDDWPPDKMYVTKDGIRLEIWSGKYDVGFMKGTPKNGTYYEFRGRFTLQRDADGLPSKGSGTGKGRIVHPSGDVENDVPDSLTITFSRIPEPAYCAELPPQ
jgi:hypothetical protein